MRPDPESPPDPDLLESIGCAIVVGIVVALVGMGVVEWLS
jgi:hypothetical protein